MVWSVLLPATTSMPSLLHCLAAAAALVAYAPRTPLADPLPDRDNGPLAGLFGFPDSREGGRTLEADRRTVALTLMTSSHAVRDAGGDASLLFDGETSRLALTWRQGVSERLELGMDVPYVLHESGGLDGFIDDWHGFFGLPEGIRDELPRDRLVFRYRPPDGETLRLDRNVRGLGDLRLTAGVRLQRRATTHTALRLAIKLPTGDSAQLLGSGSADVSVGLAHDRLAVAGASSLSSFWRLSATYTGSPDLPLPRTKRIVGQLAAGIGWQPHSSMQLVVQTRVRSRIYDSPLSPPGDVAASLTVGANLRLSRHYDLSIAVAEDVHVRSLPDVTFAIGLTWRGIPRSSSL